MKCDLDHDFLDYTVGVGGSGSRIGQKLTICNECAYFLIFGKEQLNLHKNEIVFWSTGLFFLYIQPIC